MWKRFTQHAGRRSTPAWLAWLMALTMALTMALASATAAARLYQWTSPTTGSVQMSGEPPSWYRSGQPGPRVLVFENGFLVDDTAIDVSLLRRVALRQAAFDELQRRRELDEALRRVREAGAERAAQALAADDGEGDAPADASIEDTARAGAEGRGAAADTPLPDVLDAASIARLKEIIAEFDRGGGSSR